VSNPIRDAWDLDPEVTFLNHGSFGACPRVVLERQAELRAELEREPVQFLAFELEPVFDEARAALAAFVGADPADLVSVGNATTGVNAVLRSLELAPGDEIVITNHGYNACNNAVTFVTDRAGARRVVAEFPFPLGSEDQVVAAILAAVTERTRLVLIDHITSPTALVLPVERIVRELSERGIDTLVDGAHGPGMVEIDLESLGAAYYTGNCHKWMCGPKVAAFLHVRRDLQAGVRPTVISHGANSPRTDRSRFQLEFDWTGTGDPTAWLCLPTLIEHMGGLVEGGWPEIRRRNRALALHGRGLLCDALGIDAPAPESMIGSIATVPLPPGDPGAVLVDPLQTRLFEEERIEIQMPLWPSPPSRLLRLSAQLYNARGDYERLAAALGRHLA
jgi:isopenicillin-N epimerase